MPWKGALIAVEIILFFSLFVYQLFVVYTTYKSHKKLHATTQENAATTTDRTGAYMVIFATYSQISSLISKLNVDYLGDLLGISGTMGNPNERVFFTISCLYAIISTDPFPMLKFKTMFFVLSSALKLLLTLPFLIIRGVLKRKDEDFKRNL